MIHETITVTLTILELHALRHAMQTKMDKHCGFTDESPVLDKAATLAYLKVQAAAVASGDIKGIDLELPPWAARFVLEAMTAKPKAAKAALPKKAPPAPPAPRRRAHRRTKPKPQTSAQIDQVLDGLDDGSEAGGDAAEIQ